MPQELNKKANNTDSLHALNTNPNQVFIDLLVNINENLARIAVNTEDALNIQAKIALKNGDITQSEYDEMFEAVKNG